MRIKDRPEYAAKPAPMTAPPDQTVREAVARMSDKNYGAMVVTDPDMKVLGMVTERDIMKRVVNGGLDPDTTLVSAIMTPDVRVAREEDDLVHWLRMMSNERFRRLPIVDDQGRIVSIMTQGDFVSYTWPDLINQAVEMAKSTVSDNYPIFLILGGVMLYTILLVGGLVTALSG